MISRAAGLVAILAAGVAAVWYFMTQNATPADAQPSGLPTDPAGRRARARAAIVGTNTAPIPWDWLYFQAQLETGDFHSPTYYGSNSLFNRHVGHGKGDWTGRVYMAGIEYASDADALAVDPTNALEHIRIYDSPEQSVRDIVKLYHDPLYAAALAAAQGGDRTAWYEAITRGDGIRGFVGDPNAKKAANYIAGLNATAARGVVA